MSSQNNPHPQNIEHVFKRTQKELPPHQSAAARLPDITYNPQLGVPQFGVPVTLNAELAARAFQHNNTAVGPAIVVRPAQSPTQAATRSSLGKLFKHNKCCWRCGFHKRLHVRSGTPLATNAVTTVSMSNVPSATKELWTTIQKTLCRSSLLSSYRRSYTRKRL